MSITKRAAAEFFGTFWLVFGGCGSAVLAAAFPSLGIGFVGVAFAFGLTVLTMAYAIGPVSGCHLNPAVSVGLGAGKKFPASDLAGLHHCSSGGRHRGVGCPLRNREREGGFHARRRIRLQRVWGTLAGWLFTSRLPGGRSGPHHVLPLHHSWAPPNERAPKGFAPIAIGLGLTLIHLISIPVTNTSVNPARSTGPALFVGGWALGQLWLFWVAPIVGGALGGFIYHTLFGEAPEQTVRAAESAR